MASLNFALSSVGQKFREIPGNLLLEADAEAAAATSEFMREVKGVAEGSLGEEG